VPACNYNDAIVVGAHDPLGLEREVIEVLVQLRRSSTYPSRPTESSIATPMALSPLSRNSTDTKPATRGFRVPKWDVPRRGAVRACRGAFSGDIAHRVPLAYDGGEGRYPRRRGGRTAE
jgi:hypothetical protein